MEVEPLVTIISRALGDNLKGVVLYGSSAISEDYSPLSDLNVAVIVREKPPVETMALLAEKLGHDVSTLFLTVDELKMLASDGEFIAHEIIRGGRILYADEEVGRLLSMKPPITGRTASYLGRHSLACLGLSLENYFAGRFSASLNYAFKSLRSACRSVAVNDSLVLLSDKEIVDYFDKRGMQRFKEVYLRLRESRFKGVRRGELLPILTEAFENAFSLLGLPRPNLSEVVSTIEREFRFVSDVKVHSNGNVLELLVSGVDVKGYSKEIRIPLG